MRTRDIVRKIMEAPTRKHKPIVSVDHYDEIDGQYASKTDAMALSLGKAQYDKTGKELSLKVWRMADDGSWSRMSEELPIHRNLDLSILFVRTLLKGYNNQSFLLTEDKISLHKENGTIKEVMDYYESHKKYLEPRMKELKRLLEEWL